MHFEIHEAPMYVSLMKTVWIEWAAAFFPPSSSLIVAFTIYLRRNVVPQRIKPAIKLGNSHPYGRPVPLLIKWKGIYLAGSISRTNQRNCATLKNGSVPTKHYTCVKIGFFGDWHMILQTTFPRRDYIDPWIEDASSISSSHPVIIWNKTWGQLS